MYGSEELDKQLRTLLPSLGVPESEQENLQQYPPEEPSEQSEGISACVQPEPETGKDEQSPATDPEAHIENLTTPEQVPLEGATATESHITVQSSAMETVERAEDSDDPAPEAVEKLASTTAQKSFLGGLGQARGIWDNMKAVLQEPAAARKPLLPLPASDNTATAAHKPLLPLPTSDKTAAAAHKPLLPLPASDNTAAAARKPLLPLPASDNTAAAARKPLEPLPVASVEAPVEAGPQRTQRRAAGYRSSFTFLKQKD